MAGFARIERGARQLRGIEETLIAQERGLGRLEDGHLQGSTPARPSTRRGLRAAAAGSKALSTGLGAAHEGAGALAGALQATSTGSQRLSDGLGRASEGSGKLAEGTTKASGGAGKLADAIEQASEKVRRAWSGSARLFRERDALGERAARRFAHAAAVRPKRSSPRRSQALQTDDARARQTPNTRRRWRPSKRRPCGSPAPTRQAANSPTPPMTGCPPGSNAPTASSASASTSLRSSIDNGRRAASEGMEKLADASAGLDEGLQRLAAGSRQIAAWPRRPRPRWRAALAGAEPARPGSGPPRRAAWGCSRAARRSLSRAASAAARRSRSCSPAALDRIGTGLARQRQGEGGGSQLDQLQERSPGLFHSGYFVLASLDGSPPSQRDQLGSLINIDRGGNDARMLVIPRDEPTGAAAPETMDRLEGDAGPARRADRHRGRRRRRRAEPDRPSTTRFASERR